jgi:hypothetical protein
VTCTGARIVGPEAVETMPRVYAYNRSPDCDEHQFAFLPKTQYFRAYFLVVQQQQKGIIFASFLTGLQPKKAFFLF